MNSPTDPTGARPGRLRRLLRRGSAIVAVAVGIGCPAGALAAGLGLFRWYGQARLGDVLQVGALTAIIVAGHAATSSWAWARKVPPREAVITQVPYLLTYLLALVWNFGYRFAPGYVGWAAAVLVAGSWLTVWYLREARQARRAVAYLVAMGLLIVLNGGAALLVGWRQTNGYGLVGQRAPWQAMQALAATSCMSKLPAYNSGTRVVTPHCRSGPQADLYAAAYDKTAFDNQLCGEQPRAAFQAWWDRVRRYQVLIMLDFGFYTQWQIAVDGRPVTPPLPTDQPGDTATMTFPVRVQSAFRPGDLPQAEKYPMRLDRDTETWRVTAKRTLLGGWKVCAIDVPDPVHASAASG